MVKLSPKTPTKLLDYLGQLQTPNTLCPNCPNNWSQSGLSVGQTIRPNTCLRTNAMVWQMHSYWLDDMQEMLTNGRKVLGTCTSLVLTYHNIQQRNSILCCHVYLSGMAGKMWQEWPVNVAHCGHCWDTVSELDLCKALSPLRLRTEIHTHAHHGTT